MCVKIFHAISNTPKPMVASNVSRAKVSNSVIEHHPFRSRASGARQKIFASPTLGPERLDRLPYVDSTPKVSIADVSPFFNDASVFFYPMDRIEKRGYTSVSYTHLTLPTTPYV